MAHLGDLKGEWASAIGRALIAFGSIEHVTVTCLRQIPRDRIQRSTSSFNLAPRIDLLLEILEAHPELPCIELSEQLRTAKSMAKTCNLIAHNPLTFEFYERENGDYLFNEVIVSLHKTGTKISLVQVQAFAAQAEQLASEMFGTSGRVFAALRAKASA